MRMRYKLLIVYLMCNMVLQSVCRILFQSWVPGCVLLAVEAVTLLAIYIANRLILGSNWFRGLHADPDHERYPDNIWYRKHDERNYDLINLGSNSAKYAFDYTDEPVRAMNWSSGTQTLIDDLNLVRNFHSILKKNGTVLIAIMPFTSVNKKTGLMGAFRFWGVLDQTLINPQYCRMCRILEKLPIGFGIPAVKTVVKRLVKRDFQSVDMAAVEENPMSESLLEEDAAVMINGWKRQFSITDLEQPLTEQNREGRKVRIGVMRELIDFLDERGYKVVWVIPPVSSYLARYFTLGFMEVYIYSFLREVGRDVPILDYLAGGEFQDKDMYFSSYYLNRKGSRIFTHRVLRDLREIKML